MLRNWVSQRFGQRSRNLARVHRPRRLRCLRTEMECLEGRSVLSTATSAVAWATGIGMTHHALYAIDKNDQVEVSVDGGSFTNRGMAGAGRGMAMPGGGMGGMQGGGLAGAGRGMAMPGGGMGAGAPMAGGLGGGFRGAPMGGTGGYPGGGFGRGFIGAPMGGGHGGGGFRSR